MQPIHIFLLAATMTLAGTVSAQPTSGAAPPGADAATKAEVLFQEGMRFIAQKQWADAEQRFLSAWALNPSYDVAANLGQTENKLGKYKEAARHLAYAIKNWPLVGKREPRELAEKRLMELRALLASLRIQVSAAGAMVSVDGAPVGRSPIEVEVFVDPGSHTVEGRLDGYDDAKVVVQAEKGSKPQVTLELVRTAPLVPSSSSAPPPSTTPTPEPRGASVPLVVTGAVVAGLGVAVGGALFGVAGGKASDADAQLAQMKATGTTCTSPPMAGPCTTLHNLNTSSDTLHNAAIPLLVAGSAIGAGTLLYALLPRRQSEPTAPVRVVPVAGPGGGGLWLRGAF
jgi:PEGA domain